MRTAHITRRQAEALFSRLDAGEDVFAVQEDEALRAERAKIDALIEEVDRELRAIDRRHTLRPRRRAHRAVLRSLPVRLGVADLDKGDAA